MGEDQVSAEPRGKDAERAEAERGFIHCLTAHFVKFSVMSSSLRLWTGVCSRPLRFCSTKSSSNRQWTWHPDSNSAGPLYKDHIATSSVQRLILGAGSAL